MISIRNLSKAFGNNSVLTGVSLDVNALTIVSLVGPTGCGKSTLLNLIDGLDNPDSGAMDIQPGATIGYMLQDALLLPWRTLAQNAALAAEVVEHRAPRQDIRVDEYFSSFGLNGTAGTYPEVSSGGMKQRVALIRVLLTRPTVLLLDEPFSGLDFDVKLKIQRFLLNYHEKNGTTILLVTHDIEDAIALSDEVVVLSDKPATVKAIISIDLGLGKHDPIEARKSPRFTEYFTRIWDEIKYLDEE